MILSFSNIPQLLFFLTVKYIHLRETTKDSDLLLQLMEADQEGYYRVF